MVRHLHLCTELRNAQVNCKSKNYLMFVYRYRVPIRYLDKRFHGYSNIHSWSTVSTQDIKDLTPVRGQDGKKSQTPKGKISGLQRGSAGLETNRNLSCGCLRFFRLALLPVFDSFSH